jgi:hypothetical protein
MIVKIFKDSHGASSRCRSCGARIEWCETERGKKMPFDFPIQPLREAPGGLPLRVEGRILEQVDTQVSRSHFETCPDAPKWRKRAARPGT